MCIPTDMPDLQSIHLEYNDMTVTALVASTVVYIDKKALHALSIDFPRLGSALWRLTLIDGSIYREWVANTGQREAMSRTAHMLCELQSRMQAIDLDMNQGFNFPSSQVDLGDTLGISYVHVNRALQKKRSLGLIEWRAKRLLVPDWERLGEVGDFDPAYLHLPRRALALA